MLTLNSTNRENRGDGWTRQKGRMKLRRKGGGSRRSEECVKQVRVRQKESEERWRTLFGVAFVEEE